MIDPAVVNRIARLAGRQISTISAVQRGYTPAARLVLSFTDGSTLFAKVATNQATAGFLRDEVQIYQSLSGDFLPNFVGWDDDGDRPILLLEDLSPAHWPPPWYHGQIDMVRQALSSMWASDPPKRPQAAAHTGILDGWSQVAADPQPFLSLALASQSWLKYALPTLLSIDGPAIAAGTSLLHMDVRSDNICLLGDRAILVDWNWASIGNPRLDLGFWLPSLAAEGGPLPEEIMPVGADVASLVSGFFAARSGLPLIPEAPRVRHIQLVQLRTALPWVVRSLELPPLDGQPQAIRL